MATKLLLLSCSIAAVIILISNWAAAVPEEEEEARKLIEFHVKCIYYNNGGNITDWIDTNYNDTSWGGYWRVCSSVYASIQSRYARTGQLPDEYVEALRIYHNYNDTL